MFCWEHNLKPHQAFKICFLDQLNMLLPLNTTNLAWIWERDPGWSFLNHSSLLCWEFILAWWTGRISLASNARIGILLYCIILYYIFSTSLSFHPLLSLFIFLILDTLNPPGSSEEEKSEREMGQISCPKLLRKLLYDYKYTWTMEDIWLQQVFLLINWRFARYMFFCISRSIFKALTGIHLHFLPVHILF